MNEGVGYGLSLLRVVVVASRSCDDERVLLRASRSCEVSESEALSRLALSASSSSLTALGALSGRSSVARVVSCGRSQVRAET
jgi:hypothetical protein